LDGLGKGRKLCTTRWFCGGKKNGWMGEEGKGLIRHVFFLFEFVIVLCCLLLMTDHNNQKKKKKKKKKEKINKQKKTKKKKHGWVFLLLSLFSFNIREPPYYLSNQ